MKRKNIGFLVSGVLLAVACGDTERDAPPIRCDAGGCPSGGSAGVGGTGGASGQGGSGGRGGAGGSSGAAGTGTAGSGGTTNTDAGGQAGSSSGSGGSGARDAAPDVDASRGDASDAASDAAGRRCLEPTRIQDGGTCTLAICRRGTNVEISVSRPEGWYVGALFWVLTVCDISFTRARSPGGDNRTQIYDVPDADWARMREGDPVFMHYGTPGASSAGASCGQLTKSIQNCAP